MMEKEKKTSPVATTTTTTTTATNTTTTEDNNNASYDDMSVEQLNALSPEERRQQLLDALERRNVNS